ncbi:MAG: NADH-quinone oxidoreductase subunit L [Alphaproteobacteria bacterium]|nr:NADH-quinone oxidoreductase subunit L [Alphaproteobacteria bacterium]
MTGSGLVAVPLLPLLAAALALAIGRRLPRAGGVLLVVSLAGSLAVLLSLRAGGRLSADWLAVGRFRLLVGLEATGLTWFAAAVVAATALAVSLYAIGYMRDEPTGQPRFFAGMGLFAGAMLALVLASSFIMLFAGWELVGLASYLLIGFRSREDRAVAAATRAFLMTRLGDMGLLLGWLLALLATGTTDIGAVLDAARSGQWVPGFATLLGFLMFAGAVGKSAQLPLSAWLPDAMVGPTPVSALLHSATMVAAGVFLLLRLFPLFQAAPGALALVFWTGAVTAVFAALVATAEMDLKRVLAWSTSAQLAEMMIAVGLGVPYAAALHFATHATFKATLFTAAGSMERQTGTRDLGRLGGLARAMPLTAAVFAAGALSLAGVPPFAGFWSEEAILSAAVARGPGRGLLMVGLALLTGVYIGRAGIAAFGGRSRGAARTGPPQAATMRAGMIALAVAAVLAGWLLQGSSLAGLLGMREPPRAGAGWRGLAIAAGLAGLSFGGGRAWICGGVPALGRFPQFLATGLDRATRAAVEPAKRASTDLDAIERVQDRSARALAEAVICVSAGLDAIEHALDRGARAVSGSARVLAHGAEWVEARGFGQGGDRLAAALGDGGQRLRALQTGKLYLYTLGLFVWAAGALGAGLVLLLR